MRQLRRAAVALIMMLGLSLLAPTSPASAEDFIVPIDWNVKANTTIKKLNQNVDITGGRFVGEANVTTGKITGNLTLPKATSTVKLGSLPLATAEFKMVPTKPVDGTITFNPDGTISSQVVSSFHVKLLSVRPTITPWLNLVGNSCQTRTPVNATIGGNVNLAGESTFSGAYALPKFSNCGLLVTPIINLVIPGPDNPFSATFSPRV